MYRHTRRIGPMIEVQYTIQEAISKLAQYEDVGLEPEEIDRFVSDRKNTGDGLKSLFC